MANQCFVYFLARFGTLYRPIKAKICLKLGFYWKKIRKKTLEDGKLSTYIWQSYVLYQKIKIRFHWYQPFGTFLSPPMYWNWPLWTGAAIGKSQRLKQKTSPLKRWEYLNCPFGLDHCQMSLRCFCSLYFTASESLVEAFQKEMNMQQYRPRGRPLSLPFLFPNFCIMLLKSSWDGWATILDTLFSSSTAAAAASAASDSAVTPGDDNVASPANEVTEAKHNNKNDTTLIDGVVEDPGSSSRKNSGPTATASAADNDSKKNGSLGDARENYKFDVSVHIHHTYLERRWHG